MDIAYLLVFALVAYLIFRPDQEDEEVDLMGGDEAEHMETPEDYSLTDPAENPFTLHGRDDVLEHFGWLDLYYQRLHEEDD